MGGPGKFIHLDKTEICRGKIILHPTSTYDEFPGTTWLVDGIDEVTNDFFYKLFQIKQHLRCLNFLKILS